jgi:hypothetical protein
MDLRRQKDFEMRQELRRKDMKKKKKILLLFRFRMSVQCA